MSGRDERSDSDSSESESVGGSKGSVGGRRTGITRGAAELGVRGWVRERAGSRACGLRHVAPSSLAVLST